MMEIVRPHPVVVSSADEPCLVVVSKEEGVTHDCFCVGGFLPAERERHSVLSLTLGLHLDAHWKDSLTHTHAHAVVKGPLGRIGSSTNSPPSHTRPRRNVFLLKFAY